MLPVLVTAKGTGLQIEMFLKILFCLADTCLIDLAGIPHRVHTDWFLQRQRETVVNAPTSAEGCVIHLGVPRSSQ